ncbi:LytR C-terminal domain-containing protein [Patescibacteria group bacterium]|nr:LytR C-terminal domain-containing protein [Patescibacteria group bacterium]
MQIKKRAKSVKFGQKTEKAEVKNEENKDLTVEKQESEVKEPVKEEVVITDKNVAEEKIHEDLKNEAEEAVAVEKNGNQIKHEEAQVTQDRHIAIQNEEVVKESSVSTDGGQEALVNDTSSKDEVKVDEEIQLKEPEINTVIEKEPTVNDDNGYVVQTEIKKNILRYFIVIAIVSFLIGLISMAGISFVLQKKPFVLPFGLNKIVKISPSPKPTVKVEPTKVQEVNPAEYSIEILNGSEIKGGASRLKTALTTAGFDVLSAGNAEKSDYTDTIISAKKSVNAAYIEKLRVELEKSYILDTKTKVLADETSEADVIITIGGKVSGNFE